jgi:hypothetical protein
MMCTMARNDGRGSGLVMGFNFPKALWGYVYVISGVLWLDGHPDEQRGIEG